MVEQVNTYVEVDSTPEGHNEAMIAKAESQLDGVGPDEIPEVSDRPEWLPEKFQSAEDMAKAYAELEKKLSQPKEQTTEAEAEEAPAPEAETEEVSQVLDNAGLDFNALQQEYSDNGDLTDASYEALEKAGFPRSLVDSWIAGQEAVAQDITQSIFDSVGGEDQYQDLVSWAGENLSPAEVDAFNRQIDSGDPDLVRFAVQGLNARYRSEAPAEPTLVRGETAPATSGAFQSTAELTAAMRDPRYATDPAYRKQVYDRLAKSNVF